MTILKDMRENLHLTQGELAERIGVSRSAVAMWETDKNTPPTKILTRLAAALNCTVDELLGEPQPDVISTDSAT